jgi:hypothetical protein
MLIYKNHLLTFYILKNQIVNISLASDKGEKIVVIRALHEPTKEEVTTTETIIS